MSYWTIKGLIYYISLQPNIDLSFIINFPLHLSAIPRPVNKQNNIIFPVLNERGPIYTAHES